MLWTAPMADHADSIGVGDVDGDGEPAGIVDGTGTRIATFPPTAA